MQVDLFDFIFGAYCFGLFPIFNLCTRIERVHKQQMPFLLKLCFMLFWPILVVGAYTKYVMSEK